MNPEQEKNRVSIKDIDSGGRSPSQIASDNFKRIAAEVFDYFGIQDLSSFRAGEVETMAKARFMNMKMLAVTYAFMEYNKVYSVSNLNASHFPEDDHRFANYIINDFNSKSKNANDSILIIRANQSIVRYMTYIENETALRNEKRKDLAQDYEEDYEEDGYN